MTKWQKEMFGSPSKGLNGYEVNDLNRLLFSFFSSLILAYRSRTIKAYRAMLSSGVG